MNAPTAAGSALLSGYAYMIHSRGLVMLAGYAAVGAFIAWRRPPARLSVAAAGLNAVGPLAAGPSMNPHPNLAHYPEGTPRQSGPPSRGLGHPRGTRPPPPTP